MADHTDDIFDDEAEVEPTDDELKALEAEEDDEEDEPFDDGPEEPPAEVKEGHTEMVMEGDLADRLMSVNQALYTTLKLVQKASPKVVAGVYTEIAEMRRLVGKMPTARPSIKQIGFRMRDE